jgi:hypothetical protein
MDDQAFNRLAVKRRLRIEYKFEDFWIGAFWRRDGDRFDLWVCLIPCFPIHYTQSPHQSHQGAVGDG